MKTKVLLEKLRIKKGEEQIAQSPRQEAQSLDLNSSIPTKAPLLAQIKVNGRYATKASQQTNYTSNGKPSLLGISNEGEVNPREIVKNSIMQSALSSNRPSMNESIYSQIPLGSANQSEYVTSNEGYRKWLKESQQGLTSPRQLGAVGNQRSKSVSKTNTLPMAGEAPRAFSNIRIRSRFRQGQSLRDGILNDENSMPQMKPKVKPNLTELTSPKNSDEPVLNSQDPYWDKIFQQKFRNFFKKTHLETMKEYDPIKADYLQNKNRVKIAPSNVDQFTEDTFHAEMKQIDDKHGSLGDGLDLGQKMKVMTGQLDKKLGEISEYVFEKVGKEVEKEINEFSDRITKMTSDARTYKMFQLRPSGMVEYLDQETKIARTRLKDKNFMSRLMDLDEIEAGAQGAKKVRYQPNRNQSNNRTEQTHKASQDEPDDSYFGVKRDGAMSANQSSFYNESQGSQEVKTSQGNKLPQLRSKSTMRGSKKGGKKTPKKQASMKIKEGGDDRPMSFYTQRRIDKLRNSIEKSYKFHTDARCDFVTKWERIEQKYGYDVVDNKTYIEAVLEKQKGADIAQQVSAGVPPQLLQKLQYLILYLDYLKILPQQCGPIGDALSNMIPRHLNQIVFYHNDLQDQDLRAILHCLYENQGLKSLAVINNGFGPQTVYVLRELIEREVLTGMKKLFFKDTQYVSQQHAKSFMLGNEKFLQLSSLFQAINQMPEKLQSLQTLMMSKVSILSRQAAHTLSEVIPKLFNLRNLDLSNNGLNGNDLGNLFEALCSEHHGPSRLRSLNVSQNSAVPIAEQKPAAGSQVDRFSDRLQKLIKSSHYLQHLDLSCMALEEAQIKLIISKGVKKAKSLVALHLSGNLMNIETLLYIREALNINVEEKRENLAITACHEALNKKVAADEIAEMRFYNHQVKHKLKFEEDFIRHKMDINMNDRYVFTRYLGVQEIVDGHKWQQTDEKSCYLCRRDPYCLFFWSPSLAQDPDFFLQSENLTADISKLFNKQPTDEVWISIQGDTSRFTKMLTLQEFIYRLEQNQKPFLRYTTENKERDYFQTIINDYAEREDFIKTRFFSKYVAPQELLQQQNQSQSELATPEQQVDNEKKKIKLWIEDQKRWDQIMSEECLQKRHAQCMNQVDKIQELLGFKEQIYVYAAYLPAQKTNVIIKPSASISPNYSHQTHLIFPRLNTVPVAMKHVKKVEIKKDFIKENSVFADFKAETKQVYKKCFDYDIQFSKINRLVRDLYELEKTGEVLVKYYGEIKNMFVTGIAISDYPTIQWMDFGKICETWRILDQEFPMSVIDRLFIATNVELFDMTENADRALCRFEFYEIIVRIAQSKLVELGYYSSISQATEALIENYILRFKIDRMEGQSWRDSELWTIEVDAFYKANMKNMNKFMLMQSSHVHKKFYQIDDALSLIEKCPDLKLNKELITIAFAHSKELHVKEMDDIERYNRLGMVELLEFVARVGVLLCLDRSQMLLIEKIELVLLHILPLVSEKVKYPPKTEDDEMVTDYEDDILVYAKRKHKEDHHEAFLFVEITK